MGKRVPPDVEDYIVEQHVHANRTLNDIAAEVGITSITCGRVVKRRGFEVRRVYRVPHPAAQMPEEIVDQAVALYTDPDNPLSLRQAARRFYMNPSTLSAHLQRRGIARRDVGGVKGYIRQDRRLPDELVREAGRLYRLPGVGGEGLSLDEVGKRLGLSQSGAKNAVLRSGERLRRRSWGNRNRHLPPAEVQRTIDAVAEHGTVRAAAEALGLTVSQIYGRLKMAGVPPPQRPGKRRN